MSDPVRYPVLKHCLSFVKDVTPDAYEDVIDIGVQYGTDFLIDVFPDSHHHLFEPVRTYHE